MAVVGGSAINTSFLDAGLLDEVGAEAERLRSLAADLLEEPAAAAPPGEVVR